jgi:L-arabinose transport system permease protein
MSQSLSYETPRPTLKARAGTVMEDAGMLLVLAALVIGCSIFVPNFFNFTNLDSLLVAVSTVGMISCTMLFCLASGNFDLSVGTLVPCAGVMTAVVINKTTSLPPAISLGLGIGAGLLIGALVGLLNGVVVAKLKINPLITTLATMQIVKGLGFIISDGKSVGIASTTFGRLGNAAFPVFKEINGHILMQNPFGEALRGKVIFQITSQVWICIACFLVFGFLLRRTTFGRNTLAIGGNEEAARLAGIRVDWIKIVIFTVQGMISALAGVILASRLTSGQPKSSEGLELQVISACVLGGVSLTGGVGRMSFVIAGVFIMGVVQNAMNLLEIDPFWQYVVSGTILLIAVMLDRLKQR